MSSGFTRAPPVSSVLVWEICGSTIAVETVGEVRVCALVTGSVQVSVAVLVRLRRARGVAGDVGDDGLEREHHDVVARAGRVRVVVREHDARRGARGVEREAGREHATVEGRAGGADDVRLARGRVERVGQRDGAAELRPLGDRRRDGVGDLLADRRLRPPCCRTR